MPRLQIRLNPHSSHDIRIPNLAGSNYVFHVISTEIVTVRQTINKFSDLPYMQSSDGKDGENGSQLLDWWKK